MRKSRIIFSVLLVLALVVSAVALVGCNGGNKPEEGQAESKKGGTLKFHINEPHTIDPYNAQESEGMQVTNALFDGLTAVDPITSEIVPSVAESWEANDDATVWTFKLRPDTTFHNGDKVTAESFVYGWTRIANIKTDEKNPSEIAYHLSAVKGFDKLQDGKADVFEGLKAVDENTLEVTLSYGFADFPAVVAHPALAPVPQAAVEADPAAFAAAPVGNGPFKMEGKWEHDQYIKVTRFDDYYGEVANLDGVDFMIIDEIDTAYREFDAGNLDFTDIPLGRMKEAVEAYGQGENFTTNPGKQVNADPETSIYYLIMNNKEKTLKNQKVREAVSYAINREAIVETLFEGYRIPATGVVPKGIVGYLDNQWPTSVYDVEKAKATLKEAGFEDGKGLPTLKLSFNTGGDHQNIMEMIQADLKAIGIKAELDSSEWAQYLDALLAGDYQFGRLGWIADYPIMDNFLYSNFETNAGDNRTGYSNAAFDKGVLEARSIVDEQERLAKYQELERMIGETTPIAPIFYYAHNRVTSERVHNFIFSSANLASLELCWVEGN